MTTNEAEHSTLTVLHHQTPSAECLDWAAYADEVLAHAGHSFSTATCTDDVPKSGIVVVTGAAGEGDVQRLTTFAEAGGAVILSEGTQGYESLAGVEPGNAFEQAVVTLNEHGAWTQKPGVPLRALKGTTLSLSGDAQPLASTDAGPVIAARKVGKGYVITFGTNPWYTIARIQQGYAVREDGPPSSDGSAPIDDDILKCEDGMALSMEEDRRMPPGETQADEFSHEYPPMAAAPMFTEPQADWWRAVFLQALWHAADEIGVTVPWLSYWPAGLSSIAHMSHDADQNVTAHGQEALDTFAEAGVHVTWHQVFPGGYGKEIFEKVTEAGHEQSLHYNAMHDTEISEWGWPYIRAQYAWAQAITGRENIVSNKNHYTRWEGWTEFYTWCEQLGIQIDSSRGPSKQGDAGFPFGTAHVSFPLAPPMAGKTFHDVLNLPLHTQDLAWAQHISVRDVILDGAQSVHGVAHFLFHGPHLHLRPKTRQACLDLADEARRRGMEWWTAEQISDWERKRRQVQVSIQKCETGLQLTITSAVALDNAGVLLPLEGVTCDDAETSTVERHGRAFTEVTVNIRQGTTVLNLSA